MASRSSPIAVATSLAVLWIFSAGMDCFAQRASLSSAQAVEPLADALRFLARSRQKVVFSDFDSPLVVREKQTDWDPHKTAIIICDMWDRHTCRAPSGARPNWQCA